MFLLDRGSSSETMPDNAMTIVNVAYPLAPVGGAAVGGAEQVLSMLDRHLIGAGHHSIVIACQGSSAKGVLCTTHVPPAAFSAGARELAWNEHRATIDRALHQYSVDVIHLHGLDALQYLPPGDVPVLITLHLPLSWYPDALFTARRPHLYFNCVSESRGARIGRFPNRWR